MLSLYKESSVELKPATSSSIVTLHVPTSSLDGSYQRSKYSRLPNSTTTSPAKDEATFASRYLATQSSVYFRTRRAYPRSFLWRVLHGSKTLEIRCADLSKPGTDLHEASLTLKFCFAEPITPAGVALADPEDADLLNVFVITASNPRQLHTLTLRPEHFKKRNAISNDASDWHKSCVPAPLTFAHPHRLVASSAYELFLSLDNGSLLRLMRKAGTDGSHWTPTTFDERTWGASIRGMVKWQAQQSLRYENRSIDQNTANAIATTSDDTHVFTVTLNHTLKAWNLTTNKLVMTKDLLDRKKQPGTQELTPLSLNPSDTAFLRVFSAERALEGDRYYVVTYSPHEEGQFKFWAVHGGLTSGLMIEDVFPDTKLRPPDPDPAGNSIWTVADFDIKTSEEGNNMELWVLWRNDRASQVYSLRFDLASLPSSWHKEWVSTAPEMMRKATPEVLSPEGIDSAEDWLAHLLQPGRYTQEVLETSLYLYQDAIKLKAPQQSSKNPKSLKERLCETIASTVSLRKYAGSVMDYERFREDTDSKWRQFWQIAEDVNSRRREPLSLVYDSFSDIAWVSMVDSCSILRECSATELMVQNAAPTLSEKIDIAQDRWSHRHVVEELGAQPSESCSVIQLALAFQNRFSSELKQACRLALNAEIYQDPSLPAAARISEFYTTCNFESGISDDTFDFVSNTIDSLGGLGKLDTGVFFDFVRTLPSQFNNKDSELLSTAFGRSLATSGAVETIFLVRELLSAFIALIVFVHTEFGSEEEGQDRFDGEELFSAFVESLREYEMMYWLGSNSREAVSTDEGVDAIEAASEVKAQSTILEDLFVVPIKPRPARRAPLSYVVTEYVREIVSWITRQGEVSLDNGLVFIQCDLLVNGNIDLATDFLRFQPTTAWSTYVKGRLYLIKEDFDRAAIYFQKSAYLMSSGRAHGDLHEMSSGLIDAIALDNFHNGLPKYFQHVLSLFESCKSFSHVADFARLALQGLDPTAIQEDKRRGSFSQSSLITGPKEMAQLRTDLLSRLFTASIKTHRFDEAFSALAQYSDQALQRSAISTLVTSILKSPGPTSSRLQRLLRLPVALTPNLSALVDETLRNLARKQQLPSQTLSNAGRWGGSSSASSDAPDYRKILYAYRIARLDFRGAAEVAYESLRLLRQRASSLGKMRSAKSGEAYERESKQVRQQLLVLINLLSCIDGSAGRSSAAGTGAADAKEGYILVEIDVDESDPQASIEDSDDEFEAELASAPGSPDAMRRRRSSSIASTQGTRFSIPAAKAPKRRRAIITLEDLRRDYQTELDNVSKIQRGDFAFDMDVDSDDEDEEEEEESPGRVNGSRLSLMSAGSRLAPARISSGAFSSTYDAMEL